MRFDVFTLFPECFTSPLQGSILKRALDRRLISVGLHDIRQYAEGRHRVCDDYPYGGGAGMVMKPEPIFAAVESVLHWTAGATAPPCPVILLSPQGRVFKQCIARELAKHDRLAMICGHYEGVDERVREHLVTDEISIGDYVLTGGEIPALVVIDAVSRLITGVLGDETSAEGDSFGADTSGLEYPQYTRPADFRGWRAPGVLLSGNHAEIEGWRRQESLRRTLSRRPELQSAMSLRADGRDLLEKITQETDRTQEATRLEGDSR